MDLNDKLIKLVRPHKALYDLKDEQYKNVAYKEQVWADIGQELGLDGEICRKRWKGLRDCYRRTKRPTKMASGSVVPFPRKKWRYLDAMKFLDEKRCCRKRTPKIYKDSSFATENLETNGQATPTSAYSPSIDSPAAHSPHIEIDELEASLMGFLQNASETLQDVTKSLIERKKKTTTEIIFSGLAKTLGEANLDPITLINVHQTVSQYVYKVIQKSQAREH